MVILSVTLILTIHLIIAGFFLFDLYAVSQRHKKTQWGIMLILFPLISAILYNRSKKRHRLHNG
jgi:hypothetical protein